MQTTNARMGDLVAYHGSLTRFHGVALTVASITPNGKLMLHGIPGPNAGVFLSFVRPASVTLLGRK